MVNPFLDSGIQKMKAALDGRIGGSEVGQDKDHCRNAQDARVSAVEEEGDTDAFLGRSI